MDGVKLDAAVSQYVLQYDSKYNQAKIKYLRELRNRCVHPLAHYGHVNSENLKSIREVRTALPIMRSLALLIKSSPSIDTSTELLSKIFRYP